MKVIETSSLTDAVASVRRTRTEGFAGAIVVVVPAALHAIGEPVLYDAGADAVLRDDVPTEDRAVLFEAARLFRRCCRPGDSVRGDLPMQ